MKYAILLSVLLLTACAQQTTEEITIGGLYGLSGMSVQFGTDEMQGTQLAIEEINAAGGVNGKQLKLVVEDTQSDAAGTLSAYRKLVDLNGANYIIGATWGTFSLVVIPSLEQDGVIMISPSTGEEFEEYKNPNFFKTWPADKLETAILIEHMQAHGVNNIAVLTSEGSFEQSMKTGFLEMLADKIEVTSTYEVPVDEKDFRATIEKLKQDDVDAVYMVLGDYSNIGEFTEQAQQLGFDKPLYMYSGVEQQSLLQNYGVYLENTLYPMPVLTGRDTAFNEKFATRYGHPPLTPTAATAYDATKLLAMALEQGEDIETVRAYLHTIKGYEGASAVTGFHDEFGWPIVNREYKVRTIRDGEFVDATA